jgi:hypothetical protein
MHKLIVLALLLPIGAHAKLLFVDYVGTVDEIGNAPPDSGYRLGQTIKGRLLIDLVLAPPEVSPGRSELASYFYLPWEPQPERDWVRGYTGEGGLPSDRIFVTSKPDDDWFSIGDRRDQGLDTFRSIEMTVGGIEMFTTNVLGELGAFTVTRKDKPASFAGDLIWGWGEATKHVSFFLNSFRVRPGRCKAPG